MKHKSFSIIALFALVLFLGSASSALAAYEENGNEYFMDASKKLGRSAWNVATSPLALPCSIHNQLVEGDNNVTDFFVGVGKGTVTAVNRLGTAAFEAVTFMIPSEPILAVETVCS